MALGGCFFFDVDAAEVLVALLLEAVEASFDLEVAVEDAVEAALLVIG